MKIAVIAPNPTPNTDDLIKEAKKQGVECSLISHDFLNITKPEDSSSIKNLSKYDIVFFRNGADRVSKMIFGKTLAEKNICFINSGYYKQPLLSSKIYQMYILSANGIRTPKTISVRMSESVNFSRMNSELGLPFIIKPEIGAKGLGVSIIRTEEDFQKYINKNTLRLKILQEFIPNTGDYRILVLGGKALGVYKRIPQKGEFRANISQGGHGENVADKNLKQELIEIAEHAAGVLDLEFVGIDVIKSENTGELFLIESNSIPQWQGFQDTTGINVAEKIINYFSTILQNGK